MFWTNHMESYFEHCTTTSGQTGPTKMRRTFVTPQYDFLVVSQFKMRTLSMQVLATSSTTLLFQHLFAHLLQAQWCVQKRTMAPDSSSSRQLAGSVAFWSTVSRCVCKFQQKDRNSQIPLQQTRTQSNQDDCRGEEVYLEEIVTASLQDGGHFHDSLSQMMLEMIHRFI